MTELKYIEEVFPAYRAGKTITYYSIYHPKDIVISLYTKGRSCTLERFLKDNPEATTDKGWCIIPDLVSWPEAWEALKAGKKIAIDGKEWILWPNCNLPQGIEWTNQDNITNAIENNIPILWLDRNDFEVLDED